jgi:hypothetical protein
MAFLIRVTIEPRRSGRTFCLFAGNEEESTTASTKTCGVSSTAVSI